MLLAFEAPPRVAARPQGATGGGGARPVGLNRDDELDDLLWEAARAAEEAPGEVPDDELLRRYRAAELSPAEERRVEEVLAASPGARARLAEVAGVALPAAPGGVRRRLLGAPAATGRWRRTLLPLAAGVAFAGLGLWLALRPEPGAGFRFAEAYEVAAEGLAELRSRPGSRAVLPDTVVTVRVEPRGEATAAVEFGLYRQEGRRLVRLPAEPPVRAVEARGAAVLSAPAGLLVGTAPGVRSFFVAAAAPGDLPPVVEVSGEGEAAAETSLGGGRRFARAVRLEVVAQGAVPGEEE